MKNLEVIAHLANPLATIDYWTPSFDSILAFLWLEKKGLLCSDVNLKNQIEFDIPIEKEILANDWFYKVSAPIYDVLDEQTIRYRKKWDFQEENLEWGKKKAKISKTEGFTKDYELPLKLITTSNIKWYCKGIKTEIERLLDGCFNVGKKVSQGKGQVFLWEVNEIENDFSVWKNDRLMKVFPVTYLTDEQLKQPRNLMMRTYRPPYHLIENQVMCAMPDG
jgi:CRISPR type IV-associated protein Csf3